MSPDELVLSVRNLSISRGGNRILSDVDWSVAPGEHWVILGANGSGKTSLLNAITGYLMPTSGSIHVLGQEFGHSDWRELRKSIGLVSPTLSRWVPEAEPAWETVAGGKHAMIDYWGPCSRRDRAAARDLLDQVRLSHLAGRPWMFLSQGERQRVMIARALMARFRVLVLDEPCAGLDPVAREHFLEFVEELATRSADLPLVLVTHHVEEITEVFSHALVLKAGRRLAVGPMKEVLRSDTLSRAFDTSARVRRFNGRYQMKVKRTGDSVA